MTNIFLADDHQIIREGLKRIIQDEENLYICGDAKDGNELIAKLKITNADLLLLDVSMPGPGFIENLRRVVRTYPSLKILVLSVHSEVQYAKRAFKAGASGYLTKNHSPEELIKAINRIAKGGKYISESLAEKLAFDIGGTEGALPHELLSQREYQILCLVGSGQGVGTIAENLSLSPKTVSTYRTRVLEKMGLKTTTELIHYVLNNGLND
jgi:DNA-binding NarL/FixJ family response regulator